MEGIIRNGSPIDLCQPRGEWVDAICSRLCDSDKNAELMLHK